MSDELEVLRNDVLTLHRALAVSATLLDIVNSMQEVTNFFAGELLKSMPPEQAADIARRTQDRWKANREQRGGERHPDADAKALQLLSALLRAAGA